MVIPAVVPLLKPGAEVIALIKPQFEAGRDKVGKGGIVRDAAVREAVVERISSFAAEQGFDVKGTMQSPITGQDGNVEYLIHAVRQP
jgi:23S rRNA (cytidine1920-2'-O)/16S rRNA (cytidine1409-2'-O)-methyltransferase